ncbi:MAG: sigma factor [Myxococcota bacterium]
MASDEPRAEPRAPDDEPWDTVVRRLLAWAMRLGASPEEAEDLVQDSIEVAVRDPGWFDRSRASLLTALTSVLRNRFIDHARRRDVHRRVRPHLRLVEATPGPGRSLDEQDATRTRQLMLSQLTPEERGVFGAWLRQRRGEWTVTEADASVGLDAKRFENAKKRLRRRCRTALAELEIETADLFGPEEAR